ncbi:hypothetical protein NP590_09745 [Methylomonas sp. SURF-2]|uniref:PEP-CTERM protein-sorting domain-containing protein n=1 Tax=Methylomonas subterranea TaxID=2952225 RepID=A0ABT1TFZ7_9GAMM|nr:hypothetical protein [Methylomonas sp. SURF-2]MCQ8104384.1 hypothetical protein [Methylomonas sp. SURF-2]
MTTHQATIIILITLLQTHVAAFAEEQAYQPAEYQPQTVYAESEASAIPSEAAPKSIAEPPAAIPEAVSATADALETNSSTPEPPADEISKATDNAEFAGAENPPPSDSNLALFLMAALVGAAAWFGRQKTSRQNSADAVTGETGATATGVERYLARQQANRKTGVEKYLARQTDSMPATGVSKYLAKRAASDQN